MTDCTPEMEEWSEDGRKGRICPSVVGAAANAVMEFETMSRYPSPVNLAVFPHLTVVLLAISMFFTAWFFVYEVTSTKYTRDIYKELLISLVASLFHGLWSSLLIALVWDLCVTVVWSYFRFQKPFCTSFLLFYWTMWLITVLDYNSNM